MFFNIYTKCLTVEKYTVFGGKMDIRTEKYVTLLEQRKQIVAQIQMNNQSFHTAIFSILTVYTASCFVSAFCDKVLTGVFVFIISQITIIFIYYVMGLLFAMNNDRDLIRAIDKYIEKNYGVDTLFWQGELSYRHINRSSMFSELTFVSAVIIIVLLVGVLIFRFNEIAELMRRYLTLAIVILVELLTIFTLTIRNFKYKITGKSKIMDDCYGYLIRNDKIENNVVSAKGTKVKID